MFLVLIQKNKLYMKNKYKSLRKQITVLAVLVLSTIGTSWPKFIAQQVLQLIHLKNLSLMFSFLDLPIPSGSIAGGYSDYTSLIIPMTMGTDYARNHSKWGFLQCQ
jgi:hypothetical protein